MQDSKPIAGRYQRPNGSIFDVIRTKRGLEMGEYKNAFYNRPFHTVKEAHLRTMLMFGGATKVNQ